MNSDRSGKDVVVNIAAKAWLNIEHPRVLPVALSLPELVVVITAKLQAPYYVRVHRLWPSPRDPTTALPATACYLECPTWTSNSGKGR